MEELKKKLDELQHMKLIGLIDDDDYKKLKDFIIKEVTEREY